MNRTCRIGVYLLTAALIACVTLGTQHLLLLPRVYESVHQMGVRLGAVLPQGFSDRSPPGSDRRVTLRPASTRLTLVRESMDSSPSGGVIPSRHHPRAALDLRVIAVISVAYLGALALVALSSRWRAQRLALHEARAPVFLASLALGGAVCVLCAGAYTAMRVFWTGVDSAFTARSLIQMPGSKSVHVDANLLLSMSSTELTLMLAAMVLTAAPLLIMIDARMLAGGRRERRRDDGEGKRSIFGRLSGAPIVSERLNEDSLRWVAVACYLLITLTLWAAPWSVTMAQLLWRGS